jgi:hypothetical protein
VVLGREGERSEQQFEGVHKGVQGEVIIGGTLGVKDVVTSPLQDSYMDTLARTNTHIHTQTRLILQHQQQGRPLSGLSPALQSGMSPPVFEPDWGDQPAFTAAPGVCGNNMTSNVIILLCISCDLAVRHTNLILLSVWCPWCVCSPNLAQKNALPRQEAPEEKNLDRHV